MFSNTFNNLLTEEMGIIRNVQSDTRVIVDKIKLGNYIEFDPRILENTNRNFASNRENVRIIASVLYLTYKFEQDAFLNDAYAYIISEYEKNYDITDAYEKTEAYNSLQSLRYYLDIMHDALSNNHVGNVTKDHCKSQYNMSFEKILAIGEKAYSRYSRKLARMYAQALADIRNKNITESDTYHTMTFYSQPPLEELKRTINETIFK